MARKITFTPINTSLENLQTKASENGLILSELYYITDYEVLAQATSVSTFKAYEIPTELSQLVKGDFNLDERYYTETEINTKLLTKSDTTHNHALSNLSEKSYNSLTDKPTILTLPIAINDVSNLQTTLDGKINNYTRLAVNTLTIDCSTADIFEVTLTVTTPFSLSNVPTNKDKSFEILNNSGAEITITLPTSQYWESQTVKIGANKIKEFTVRSNGTRQIWHVSAELKNA